MYSSDSDDYYFVRGNSSSDAEDSDDAEDCRYCDATYKIRNRQRHLDNVHKCPHCKNYMPRTSIPTHIENKHMVACSYCNLKLMPAQMRDHEVTHFVRCQYCPNYMPKTSIPTHIENKHMVVCSHCDLKLMPAEKKDHEATHFVRCQYCNANVLTQNVNAHIADRHPFHATIGMIRKIDDAAFNRLVAENRVYAKDGHLFIK